MAQVCSEVLVILLLGGLVPRAWSQTAPAGAAGAASTPDDDRVVISVGDEKITAAKLKKILDAMPPQYRAYYGGTGKRLLPQYIVQMKILAAEALKQKLEDQPEVRQAVEIARESILADAARKRLEEGIPVSEQQVQQLYDHRKSQLEEVRVRHILIRTETSVLTESANTSHSPLSSAEARKKLEALRQQILAGADFAQLAKANSDDLSTAGNGGDMGYVDRQTLVPPVAEAAFSLSPGGVSEIISTPYGLDLIKVEHKRTKPLDEVRPLLETQFRQNKFQQVFQQLQSQYKVVVDSEFFGPQPAGKAKSVPPGR